MEWLNDLIEGVGSAITDAFHSLWETASGSIWEIFLGWIYESVYGAIADCFTLIDSMGIELFELSWVQAYLELFRLFGWALFIVGLVVAVFDIAIEYQSMRQFNIKRQMLPLLYGFLAVNLFTVVPIKLYTFCVNTQNTLMHELASLFASEEAAAQGLSFVANMALSPMAGAANVFNLLAIIALGYCVIQIFFANIKRGGILLTQIAVGSLYMFSVPKGYTDGFTQWCRHVVALCLTAFLQTTLLYLGLITWQSNLLLGLGVMLSANEVPRIAQAFGLDFVGKGSFMNAVHTTTSAVNLAKTIVKK